MSCSVSIGNSKALIFIENGHFDTLTILMQSGVNQYDQHAFMMQPHVIQNDLCSGCRGGKKKSDLIVHLEMKRSRSDSPAGSFIPGPSVTGD